MHWSHGLQGSLKRRYKHPSPTSINGYHTAKKLLSQSPAKRPTFAFADESGYTLAFANRIAHSGSPGETGGVSDGGWYLYPRSVSHVSETLRGQVSERQTLPLLGLGRVCSRRTRRACGTAMRSCVSLFRRRRGPAGLRDLFRFCRNCGLYTLGSPRKIAHKGTHAEIGGVLGGGAIITLDTSCTFTNIPGPGIRTANFAAFGSWSEALPKNAESLRDSDALMRVAVPRRRSPAGLRDLFRFCRSCGLYALFQILLSVLQTLQLVLFLCKLRLGLFLVGSELFKGFRFCHCA